MSSARPIPRRLDKLLADARLGSRSWIERTIRQGLVRVDGRPAERFGMIVDPLHERIEVEGQGEVRPRPPRRWTLWHKPAGIVTTMAPSAAGNSLLDALPSDLIEARAQPVGRLDRDTTGALLLTDDGDLAYLLLHPRHAVFKRYRVSLTVGSVSAGAPTTALRADDPRLEALRAGVMLDGRRTRPARVDLADLEARPDSYNLVQCLMVSIAEGRHHQVRRMIASVGLRLTHLHREAIGSVELGEAPPGAARELSPREVEALYDEAGGRGAPLRCAVDALRRKLEQNDCDPREREILASFFIELAHGAVPSVEVPATVG